MRIAIVLMLMLTSQVHAGLAMRGLAAVRANMSSIPRDGLVAEYLFDTDARDTSGNGWNGSLVGNASCDGVLNLDGSGDYVTISTNLLSRYFTISAWCNSSVSNSTQQSIVAQYSSSVDRRFYVYSYLSSIRVFSKLGATPYIGLSYPISTGEWYHLIVFSGTNGVGYYVDGEYVDIDPDWKFPYSVLDVDTVIGAVTGGSYPFNGTLDNIRIYNKQVSSDTVSKLYNEGHD